MGEGHQPYIYQVELTVPGRKGNVTSLGPVWQSANGVRPSSPSPEPGRNLISLGPVWQRVPTVGIYCITYTTACAMATGMQGEPPLDPSPAIMLNGNLIRPSELAAARNFCRPPVVQRGQSLWYRSSTQCHGRSTFRKGLGHPTLPKLGKHRLFHHMCPRYCCRRALRRFFLSSMSTGSSVEIDVDARKPQAGSSVEISRDA